MQQGIEYRRVGFRYADGHGTLLRNVSFTARPGEVVAIVGTSGSGKTTLVNLLPRFYDVSDGAILIDGLDVRQATLASLRAQIGLVTQETVLFNDSVRANIAYGMDDVDEARVESAARAAFAHDFVLDLPRRYDTIIGERGSRLSGGQKQRIAIARAILKDPPILILDEATSALDTESERLVQSALANLMRGRTTLVIAHRLTTVRAADRIVVLDGGEVREVGCHDELMRRPGGLYNRLHELLESEPLRAAVSVRSLNHRFLDVAVHLSRRLQVLETEAKERVARTIGRGRVEVQMQASLGEGPAEAVVASRPLVSSLVRALRDMQNEFGLEGGVAVSDLVRYPGALERVEAPSTVPDDVRDRLLSLLGEALGSLDAMRRAEGERLRGELERALGVVEEKAACIEARSAGSREEREKALAERVRTLAAEHGLEDPRH
jgi:ABC-type methionine transport system ATPase subunit